MTPDPLHTIIARQQSGNALFLIVTAIVVLGAIGVGYFDTIPGAIVK